MKQSGRCPKCSASDVHVVSLEGFRFGSNMPYGPFANAEVDHYVCAKCGYVETYVSDEADLKKIAEKWPRVEQ